MKIRILIIVLTFCAFSCGDDVLDERLRSQPTLEEILSNEESILNFVNGAYAGVQQDAWNKIVFYRQIMDMASDDCWAGNTEQPRPDIITIAHYNNVDVGSPYFRDFWNYNYRGITRCNVIIQEIDDTTVDEELKSRLIGETKFLRAFFYFQLVKNFGGVPIIMTFDELLQPEIITTERSPAEDIYNLIEADLLEAIDLLPLKSEYSPGDLGRATKGAAQGYLAKVYLFREKWSEAAAMANNVIQSGEYDLEPNFDNVWNVENQNGVEVIFEIRHRDDAQNTGGTRFGGSYGVTTGSRADGGWNWSVPSSYLEQAFIDEGDDIRLRNTIIKHGDPVYGDPDAPQFDAAPDRNKSARINRKFYIPQAFRGTPHAWGNTPLNHIFMRYADLLLMYAEASYFSNDESEALDKLRMVRSRVNLSTDGSLSGDALRDAIWKERRLELALEQHRIYDLRRQKVNGQPRINQIFGPEGAFVNYNLNESTDEFELTNLGEDQAKGSTFDPDMHLLWPIPTSEIILSQGVILQNPGY